MRDPYSVEAEHGVLGAMFLRPELIDILSADLAVDDFYYQDNAALYRGILALHAEGKPADAVTVGFIWVSCPAARTPPGTPLKSLATRPAPPMLRHTPSPCVSAASTGP
jgi:Replicative DNA helicase